MGVWTIDVPCTAERVSSSNGQFTAVVFKALEALKDHFRPDWLSIFSGITEDVRRDSISKPSEMKWHGEGDKRFCARTTGFSPANARDLLLEITGSKDKTVKVTDLQAFGSTKIVDLDRHLKLTEIWEDRSFPANHSGLSYLTFTHRFPIAISIRLVTQGRMYQETLCDEEWGDVIDNTEIASRNRELLSHSLRELESFVGSEIVSWHSDIHSERKYLYRHGFKDLGKSGKCRVAEGES